MKDMDLLRPEDGSKTTGVMAAEKADQPKLWLWRNGPREFWGFEHCYPIHMNNGDPQTLGEPCGYVIVKPSRSGRPNDEGRPEDYGYFKRAPSERAALIEKCAQIAEGYAEARLKDMEDPGVDRDYVQGERHGALDLAQAIRALAEREV